MVFVDISGWSQYYLKIWRISQIEIDNFNKIVEQLPMFGKFPIFYYIKFRLCLWISILNYILPHIFYVVFKEFTFILVKSNPIFFEDIADTDQIDKNKFFVSAPKYDIINDSVTAADNFWGWI